ncbi:MAG TPA: hypothetical protein VK496_01685, partial [Gaiellaceae bacterium]|nr:hypothetical protein [Gaiellaceae bacterium]
MRGPRLALGVAGAACLLLLAPLAGASNSSPYADEAADAPAAAPDLTAVHVSNDDAGNVFFRISIPNRAALAYTDLISLFVDADGKIGTGCARGAFGAEYALDVLSDRFVFGRCAGGSWDFTKRPASFSGSFAGSTLTLKANRCDLGGASRFAFRIGAAAATGADPAYDFAPDIGTSPWSYQVIAPPQGRRPPRRRRASC